MRTMKILAVSTLVVGFMATSAFAGDCSSKTAQAETAKAEVAKSGACGTSATAETASATAAKAGGCDSAASTAAVKTASAGGCDSKNAATAKTASAGGCDKSAATASTTKVAGAGCSSSATAAVKTAMGGCDSENSQAKMAKALKVETVRMPSGAMAVFYHGKNAETVAFLQKSAEKGCQGFACDLAKSLAADENCKVEMAMTETGVMMLVTSEKADVVDQYEAQYAAVIASVSSEQGE